MRLVLLRHAKSSWDTPGLRDHDRPLAPRGLRAAPAMARHLRESDFSVDLVVTSTAVRARETIRLFLDELGGDIPLVESGDLFHAEPETLLQVAEEEGKGAESVMLVGHNPGMHDLALSLCGDGDARLIHRLQRKFPTGALAEFDLPEALPSELPPNSATLLRFLRPKDLPRADSLGL